jgi:phosphatidylserine/phosphatidylglycerophosphate/cardiolipin synthase-like enzyme
MHHLRKIMVFALFVSMTSFFQVGWPSVLAAEDRTPPLLKPVDQSGRPLTLLKNKAYFHALSEKIRDARSEIVMAYFLFKTNNHPRSYPEILLQGLGAAARRGVRVTVVLEQDDKPDSSINRDNRNAAERLRQAGVEIYFDAPKKTTHTKLAVVDRRYTFIGSHNLTQSALKHNNELSVLIDSPVLAEETLNYIKSLY